MSARPHHRRRLAFSIFRARPDLDAEIDAELAYHFEKTVESLVESGWPAHEAQSEAERRFGDLRAHRCDLARIGRSRVRQRRVGAWLDRLGQHLRAAFRGLRRAPVFSAAIILTLGLGLGANAALFDTIDRLLLSPPQHLKAPERLRLVYNLRAGEEAANYPRALTVPDVDDLQDLDALASIGAYTTRRTWTLGSGVDARQIRVQQATASYFTTLGVQPRLGRLYEQIDDQPDAPLTAVISESFWRNHLGGQPSAIGRTLAIGRNQYEVIGITPRGFTGAEIDAIDVWLPLRASMAAERGVGPLRSRTSWWVRAVVRLAPEVSPESAATAMTTAHIAAHQAYARGALASDETAHARRGYLEERYLELQRPRLTTAPVIAGRGANRSTTSAVALWLAGVSLVVLLIACANVANLLLARGIRRRREMAVQVALGADRGWLIGRALVEAFVLAGLGALTALIVARWTNGLVRGLLLPDLGTSDGGVTGRLMLFVLVASVVAALMAGLPPALAAGRATVADRLRAGTRGIIGVRTPLRSGLMIVQTTLTVLLLIGAGLFVRSLRVAGASDVGFEYRQALVARIETASGTTAAHRATIYRRAREAVAQRPGVEVAALLTETIPLRGYNNFRAQEVAVPGLETEALLGREPIYHYSGTEGFFTSLGMRPTRGVPFAPAAFHAGGEPVAMISESLAQRLWPQSTPIGACIALGNVNQGVAPPCRRIVGTFDDLAIRDLSDTNALAVATPAAEDAGGFRALIVRTDGFPNDVLPTIRRAVLEVDPAIRYAHVDSMSEPVERLARPWRLGATLFVAFGALALAVAAVGLYSLLSFDIAQRRRELGIRAALGAGASDLVRVVASQATRHVTLGLLLGASLALAIGPSIRALLFGVHPADPIAFLGGALALGFVALLASLAPARRAIITDPAETMRSTS